MAALITTRRKFLETGGFLTAGILFLPSCASRMLEGARYLFFTEAEAECVIALCAQLIPSSISQGGATEAGVVHYIDRQLSEVFHEHGALYKQSIQKLQEVSKEAYGVKFERLDSVAQYQLMKQMEGNKIDAKVWEEPSKFFGVIRNHAMQGFYGSPIHGGNKDYMSFNMIGLDYPINIGQNRYILPLHETL